MKASHRNMAALLLLLVGVLGCGKEEGPKRGQAKGQVTFAGQPVTEGTVSFFNPTAGFEFDAAIGQDGSYHLVGADGGVPVGDYVITVRPPRVAEKPDERSPGALIEKDAENIPPIYRQANTSPLRATITEGTNEVKVEMVSQ